MFLHIGGDYSVAFSDILSIHDYEKTVKNAANRDFLEKRRESIIDISDSEPKSIIVTPDKLYISAISTLTLKGRMEKWMK